MKKASYASLGAGTAAGGLLVGFSEALYRGVVLLYATFLFVALCCAAGIGLVALLTILKRRRKDTPLFGLGLGLAQSSSAVVLVRFIVMVEEKVEDETGVQLTLASDQALSRRHSPFATLQSLATYVEECLTEAQA